MAVKYFSDLLYNLVLLLITDDGLIATSNEKTGLFAKFFFTNFMFNSPVDYSPPSISFCSTCYARRQVHSSKNFLKVGY